jgi:2-amino-4-hydroxy-6-hydroxymethyldihydropteridine diphosphokinase
MVNAVRAYLGIGSNEGDRHSNLLRAVDRLRERGDVSVARVSSFLENPPVGGPAGQGMYLNAVVAIDTALTPRRLLAACKQVEGEFGRASTVRWGPRVIDLDILLYGDLVVGEPDLEIPHPRMHERTFVLIPLAEIDTEVRHPVLGLTAGRLLSRLVETKKRCGEAPNARGAHPNA